MKEDDVIDISIKIANQHLGLKVPFNQQDEVREIEDLMSRYYTTWRKQYPRKSESELLAMLAYQFASYYYALRIRQQGAMRQLEDVRRKLDKALT
jgi:hypothetical protein